MIITFLKTPNYSLGRFGLKKKNWRLDKIKLESAKLGHNQLGKLKSP